MALQSLYAPDNAKKAKSIAKNVAYATAAATAHASDFPVPQLLQRL